MTRPGARVLVQRRTTDFGLHLWQWKCSAEHVCDDAFGTSYEWGPWHRNSVEAYDDATYHARTCTALHLARLREQVGAALVVLDDFKGQAWAAAGLSDSLFPAGSMVAYGAAIEILARLTGVPFPADAAVTE